MRRLTTLFPSEFLEEHAEELGVVERDRKLQIPAFVWAFVFGFAAGESRTLASFRRSYNLIADETISPGGFYHRLTPSLAEHFRDLVEHSLDEVAVPDTVNADINRFRDVMIGDGSVLRLHEILSEEFQARKEEQAGAKLHLLHNATEQTIERLDVTDEKTHDSTLFSTGSWLEDRLILFDRAYFKYRRFALIDENGGYFVSRLKEGANPVVTEELREWRASGHITRPLVKLDEPAVGFYALSSESVIQFPTNQEKERICGCLEGIREQNPGQRILLVLGNFSSHVCEYTRRRAHQLGIDFVFLPVGSPYLNPIEQVWKSLKWEASPLIVESVAEYRALLTELFEQLTTRLSFAASWIDENLGGYLQKLR